MLTKPLLLALLAACGVNSSGSGGVISPSEKPLAPPDDSQEDGQHFCCTEVDEKNAKGDGCLPIGKEHITSCSNVLYCGGSWVKKDGKVTCIE